MIFDIRECGYFEDAKKRFLSKIQKTDNCWLWLEGKVLGYGHIRLYGKTYKAHRISYMLFNGPIPWDKLVRHTCDNKACVNPEHLILGSTADNAEDALKRQCLGGQKLTKETVREIKWQLKYQPQHGLAASLARQHKVHPTTIERIKNRRTWHWVEI